MAILKSNICLIEVSQCNGSKHLWFHSKLHFLFMLINNAIQTKFQLKHIPHMTEVSGDFFLAKVNYCKNGLIDPVLTQEKI